MFYKMDKLIMLSSLPEDVICHILYFIKPLHCAPYKMKESFLNKAIFTYINEDFEPCNYTYNNFFTFCNTHNRIVEIHEHEMNFCTQF